VRPVEVGESLEDKETKLIAGIKSHYSKVYELAEQKRQAIDKEIPIVAMGHLFTAGGKTLDGDGVRELYVGSIAHVAAGIFPENIDYLALGHLHVPQKINESDIKRYSGSPIAMGFGEARQEKSICYIEFNERKAVVSLITVPVFQQLESIKGSWEQISARIVELATLEKLIWLEIIYEGEDVIADLREQLETLIDATEIEILRVKNNRIIAQVLNRIDDNETLDDLDVNEVFERCLSAHEVTKEQRSELLLTYQEAIVSMNEDDNHAE